MAGVRVLLVQTLEEGRSKVSKMQAMTIEQALTIIGSLPSGREALQCLIDDNGWFIEDPKIIEFLEENDHD